MKKIFIVFIPILIPVMLFTAFWIVHRAASGPLGQEITGGGAPWYHTDWHYRTPVTITNSSTALTDYQVLVELDSSFDFSHAQTDGVDLRVTADDGTTLLSFWIESWDNIGLKAWVWVKVPSLPSGDTGIYLYYGNESATSASDGKGTFVIYDGFEAYAEGTVPTGDYTNPGEWARYAGNPVLTPGPAAWDAAGATFASVISDTTAGEYRMYYHGIPVSGLHQIGLATSADGMTWTKYASNPVMLVGAAGTWDASGVRVPVVWKEGPTDYRMMYTGSGSGGMQVGYATSMDGISWSKYAGNPVFNDPNAWAHGSTENWAVIKVGTQYLMWYGDLSAPRESSIATSTDLINWTPIASTPIFATSGVPSDYQYSQFCPYTFTYGGYYYVLVPSYTSVGDYSRYYLYRSSSPYFPTSDRHLVRVVHTVGATGQWDARDTDTPFVLTMDIERSIFPNDQLWTYYAGAAADNSWREGMMIETDIAAALTDAALPGGTLTWAASGNVTVVSSPVRQGLRSLRIYDPDSSSRSLSGIFTSQAQGVIGAWMRRDNYSAGDFDIYLYDNSTLAAVAGLGRLGEFHYWNGTFQETVDVAWSTNTWYLVTLAYNAVIDRYDFVVFDQALNEIVRVNNISFGNAATVSTITRADFYTSGGFNGNGYGDDFRLRENVSPVPTVQTGTGESAVDMRIEKTAHADTIYAGEPLTYTIVITNSSEVVASGVVVTDVLPVGASLVSVTPEVYCSQADPVVCNLGSVTGGIAVQITLVITSSVDGEINNTAMVDSGSYELKYADNQDSVATTVLPVADLWVSQTSQPLIVYAGDLVTYTITVHNDGPSSSADVTLVDTLSSRVAFVSAEPLAYCVQASPVVCTLPGLASGGESQVQVVVRALVDGMATNVVTATSSTYDPDMTNNTNQYEIVINPQADLSVIKVDQPDPLYVGDVLTYTISVHNAGPSRAFNVWLTDTLPAEVTVLSATPDQGSCTLGSVVTCDLEDLRSGRDAVVTVTVMTSLDGVITNTAVVTSNRYDHNLENNTSEVDTTVLPVADLWVSQVDTPDPTRVGDPLTYTVTTHNDGLSSSADVILTNTLPSNVTFVSAGPSCVGSGPVVCTLPGLPSGGESQVQVVVIPLVDGLITNTVTVTTSTFERNLENNSNEEDTVVATAVDLSIEQEDVPDPVIAEQELTYILTVQNAGPSIAGSIQLTDTLPGGVTLVSVTPEQGSCSLGSVITCELGNLINGAEVEVEVVVIPQVDGIITNIVEVATRTHDGNLENNSSMIDTTVLPAADLWVSQVDTPDPTRVGDYLMYTVTTHNDGPSSSVDVILTDTLSSLVEFVSADAGCVQNNSVVVCTLPGLAADGESQVQVVVIPQAEGSIVNTVEVASGTYDGNLENNTSEETTSIDDAPPYIEWFGPVKNEQTFEVKIKPGVAVTLTVIVSDTIGIDRVRFVRWDHAQEVYVEIGLGEVVSPDMYEFVWVFQRYFELPEGINQIFAYAYDTAGNSARRRIWVLPYFEMPYNVLLPVVLR